MATYIGFQKLPQFTEEELKAWREKQYHKLNGSAHVEEMRRLVLAGASVAPGDINGVVLAYDSGNPIPRDKAYVMLVETEEAGLAWRRIPFLGGGFPPPEFVDFLQKADRQDLLDERARQAAKPIRRVA